jgi:NDP-sugar pyrophosphorylase family protein
MISRALILAAGLGTRLRGQWDEQPKGLLPVDGLSLIARSVAHLQAAGLRDIVLVTGHLASRYEEWASNLDGLRCVHNPDFARAGSFFSLCIGAAAQPGPFLLLESDLLYEPAALDAPAQSSPSRPGAGRTIPDARQSFRDGLPGRTTDRSEQTPGSCGGRLRRIRRYHQNLCEPRHPPAGPAQPRPRGMGLRDRPRARRRHNGRPGARATRTRLV